MQAYCVKCRAKKEMKDAKSITMKNGKPATQEDTSSAHIESFTERQQQWRGKINNFL
ncbi:DUF5679 domain-containing protein [Chloroflexota bacterium]